MRNNNYAWDSRLVRRTAALLSGCGSLSSCGPALGVTHRTSGARAAMMPRRLWRGNSAGRTLQPPRRGGGRSALRARSSHTPLLVGRVTPEGGSPRRAADWAPPAEGGGGGPTAHAVGIPRPPRWRPLQESASTVGSPTAAGPARVKRGVGPRARSPCATPADPSPRARRRGERYGEQLPGPAPCFNRTTLRLSYC